MLFDGNGSKSCWCNEPGHVQTDRWFVRDEEWQKEIVVVQLDVKKARQSGVEAAWKRAWARYHQTKYR